VLIPWVTVTGRDTDITDFMQRHLPTKKEREAIKYRLSQGELQLRLTSAHEFPSPQR